MTLLSPAAQNCTAIMECKHRIEKEFLNLGYLLWANQENGYWNAAATESFDTFLKSVNISLSYAGRLIHIAKIVASGTLTAEVVQEIGSSKMVLLLPKFVGEVDTEKVRDLVEIAKSCTVKELRSELGHKVVENEGETILCPHCGVTLRGLKFAGKEHRVDYNGGELRLQQSETAGGIREGGEDGGEVPEL